MKLLRGAIIGVFGLATLCLALFTPDLGDNGRAALGMAGFIVILIGAATIADE